MNNKNIKDWKNMGYGMFIHFGLFSLCGGKWKNKKVENGYSEQIMIADVIPQLDYYSLAEKFEIPNFSAKEIVSLAKDAGMKYITLVTKHHDGFCLFDTKTTTFSSINTPYNKDIVKELADECKKQGIKLGVYFSWIDWHYPLATPMSDTNSDVITDEHQKYNLAQLTELLSNYGEIVELWMDMGKPTEQQSIEIRELAHTLQPNIMINSRIWNNYGDFLTMGDNDYPEVELDLPWQVPATIFTETWGYRSWQKRENVEAKIKDLTKSITTVLDLGGNFLLNIGPDNTGAIVEYEKQVLLGIGENLKERKSFRIPKPKQIKMLSIENLENQEPTKHYNYCGSEYYSNKPVLIGLSWRIKVEPNKDYTLGWMNKNPLKKDLKLKLSIDNNTYFINLLKNFSSSILSENIKTNKDYIDISLSTIGENLRIPKFEESEIVITLK
jgi:alpha-L-fucosidase